MDGDDEPAMTYFLPNGIADDSPPKQSRIKASFGRIGGRSAGSTSIQSTATSPGHAAVVSASSGTSNSRSDVDFSHLHTRPHPTLEPSPFGSSVGSASSPRPTNYLLSDLGGEIHTPRASRDFGDAGGSNSRSNSPFRFTGSFGAGLSDTGTIGGAGAIRSPTSMFDRGQEAAKSFSMHGEGRRSLGTSTSYGSEAQQLYRGGVTSYLNTGDSNSRFGSSSIRTSWPSSTDVAQPRRALQSPPGLAGPPGLSEPSPFDRKQTHVRFGSGGEDIMQQRISGSQFGSFHPSTSSPIAGAGTSNRAFSSDDQYGSSLLSSLRNVYGDNSVYEGSENRSVPNPNLAELNTHSMRIGEMEDLHVRQAADLSSVIWGNPEPTTSRRIDIQARSKTPRSPKKARDGRKKPEGRSDLRAKALEFSMDTTNAFTPGSPTRPRRSERARKMTSPVHIHEYSSFSFEPNRNDQQAPRGKRRNQFVDNSATSSSLNTSGHESRRRGPTNQNEGPGAVLNYLPDQSTGDSGMKSAFPSGKLRRREDIKSSNRSISRRNPTRGNDKGAGTTRRQVYREKQVQGTTKEPEETTPKVALPEAALSSTEGNLTNHDTQKAESNSDDQNLSLTRKTKIITTSPTRTDIVTDVAKLPKYSHENVTDLDDLPTSKNSGQFLEEVESDTTKFPKKSPTDEKNGIITSGDPAEPVIHTTTERKPSSSSELPDDGQDSVDEPSESRAESDDILSLVESSESEAERSHALATRQPLISPTNQKRMYATPPAASTGNAPPEPLQVDKKNSVKEHRKEKTKKDKGDKKKATRGKKDKRGSALPSKGADTGNDLATEAQDELLEALVTKTTPLSTRISQGLYKTGSRVATSGLQAFLGTRRSFISIAGRLNVKGLLATTCSCVESVLAVAFSVVLLLSLHVASWFIRIHRVAFRAILTHRHIGFCFAFLYGFPFLVQYVFPWAPPWAPVCLWYAFLVQLFCTSGPKAMVTTFRIILPLVFLVEGISHHSFLLDLNGAELLLTSFIISALKTSNLCSPIFFLSLATQCLLAVFLGSELLVQWLQLALALYSLHVMAATDDEWNGMGDDEDELSCHSVSMHHSIADYNHHPAPSSAVSIQKTKRLDRRALAYVRGRKLR
ncbi:Hypothetical protein PHPALM_16775 [Phytophthora palmivora]|uniref:Transmembrane protein n=1 Tax=Phytophthora palmivora TaxID=4796 RepID=A0A2P4XNX8_9STRA|nr:Hypothetical protein PHPALM_16775 [Phytophthora palmivora]